MGNSDDIRFRLSNINSYNAACISICISYRYLNPVYFVEEHSIGMNPCK